MTLEYVSEALLKTFNDQSGREKQRHAREQEDKL